MKHVLRISALGKCPEIPISADQYQSLKVSREVLINALAIEEKYELILSNYLAFEKRCLEISCEHMVRTNTKYSEFFDIRLSVNTNLVNLLTSARLYVDQLIPHFSACTNKTDAKDIVKGLLSDQYDANPQYRFMEALRNFVQHRGLPVHLTSHGGKWTSLETDGLLEFSIYVGTDKGKLEEDGEFKQSVLDEIPDKVDLVLAARSYVESLSSIHQDVRDQVKEPVTTARADIETMHAKYSAVYDAKLTGLAAQAWSDHSLESSMPLLLDWDDIRIELQKRNSKLVNLSKRYVTGRTKDDP